MVLIGFLNLYTSFLGQTRRFDAIVHQPAKQDDGEHHLMRNNGRIVGLRVRPEGQRGDARHRLYRGIPGMRASYCPILPRLLGHPVGR